MKYQSLGRRYLCALTIALAAATLGCRRRDPYTDGYLEITRAEKMDLEDQIYALEDRLAERDRELEALRGRKPVGGSPARRTGPAAPPTIDDDELLPPSIEPGTPFEPKIELPPVEATPVPKSSLPGPRRQIPLRAGKPAADIDDLPPPALDEGADDTESLPAPRGVSQASFRTPAAEPEIDDPTISNIFINPFHTAGVELDQQPGDDGIAVLIEPRNEAGQCVLQAGAMTIVVLDPAIEGEAARVARWELSKSDVAQRILDTKPERGVKLKLKWPEQCPEHGKLKLFVRYTNAEGAAVEAHSDVFISLPGELSQRWTPRRE